VIAPFSRDAILPRIASAICHCARALNEAHQNILRCLYLTDKLFVLCKDILDESTTCMRLVSQSHTNAVGGLKVAHMELARDRLQAFIT
jgi:hypothetical protein